MATENTQMIIDNVDALQVRMKEMRKAQQVFATYTQEQVDKIFFAAAMAANKARIPLAKMAVQETGMGVVEDKVIKNHYASEYIYNAYRDTKTCGVIEEDKAYGIKKIAEPIGLIAAVIPTTNPTSTAIFKTLLCLKTRNAIIISPHPRAKESTIAAAKVVYEAAVAAGAPENIISWIDVRSCVNRTPSWQPVVPAWSRQLTPPVNRLWASAQATHRSSSTTLRTFAWRSIPLSIPKPLTTV